MKNKKIAIGTMLLLFAISGICNIISVSAEEVELPPLSYLYYGFDVDYRDELDILISSTGTVNVYIMEEYQFDLLVDSGGLILDYIKRWQDITYLEYTYTIPVDNLYYVVIYNKNVLYGRTVEIDIKVNLYFDIKPVVAIIISIGVIVVGIILTIILVKRSKRKKREAGIIQVQENAKTFYCSNYGSANIDVTSDYCSKCGYKVNR